MRITNIHNFPQALIDSMNEEYIPQDNEYRVTSLLKGCKETILLRRYHDVIEVDVSDMIWMIFGTAVHKVFEETEEKENEIKEMRLLLPVGDFIVSGQFDRYDKLSYTIEDYKTTSVWSVIKKEYTKWKEQLSIYSLMIEKLLNLPVLNGKIIAFLKDHSKAELKRNPDYPPHPVHEIDFEITDEDKFNAEKYLTEKLALLAQYTELADDDIPECSPEDRWTSDWAVMKTGNTRATRLLPTSEEAWLWIEENVTQEDYQKYNVVSRGDRKCMDYCYVNKYCHYWKEKYGKY